MSERLRILIAGCGYVGCRLGRRLLAHGAEVFGLRRRISLLPTGIQPLCIDLASAVDPAQLPGEIDAIVYAVSAGRSEESAYRTAYIDGPRHLLRAVESLDRHPPLIFVSSTGVYGQSEGQWVDETSETLPTRPTGKILVEGEQQVASLGFDATIVRFSGIYGPGRTRLIEAVRAGTIEVIDDPPRWTNRIHVDDCAAVLHHLLNLQERASLYLASDNEPAARHTVWDWLAGQLNCAPPRRLSSAPPDDPDGRSPRSQTAHAQGQNKRCSNHRLRASGFRFRYPTFREGYGSLLATKPRHPDPELC